METSPSQGVEVPVLADQDFEDMFLADTQAQGARPCCLSTIYHLIPRQFSVLTILLFSESNLKVLPAYLGFDYFRFLPLLWSFQKLMRNVWKMVNIYGMVNTEV